ncbi:MAG: SIS domain-containing protein [Thermodesulfobacteriota bacterium]
MKNVAVKTVQIAKRVLDIEAEAVADLARRVGEELAEAVEIILSATGRVVVTGMGKSGIICKKIASTLSSTGTPAFFLHPSEGVHGDIGMLMKDDVVIAISNSGTTDELIRVLPIIKRMGVKMIAMTGDSGSTLARAADVTLDVGVREEACPLGLAPTASTTAALAMGDAVAVALLERRGFREEDFASLHPAGSLGRKLLKVADLMHTGESLPLVQESASMGEALREMTAKRLGITGIVDGGGVIIGAVTDGDLRRSLEDGGDIIAKMAVDVMSTGPKVIGEDHLAEAALKVMEEFSITALFVTARLTDEVGHGQGGEEERRAGRVVGIIHLHDLLKAGVV